MIFRLGKGQPYTPFYTKSLTSTTESESDFTSGDKEFSSLKDLLDFIMSEIKDKPYSMTIQPHKKTTVLHTKRSCPFLYVKNVVTKPTKETPPHVLLFLCVANNPRKA